MQTKKLILFDIDHTLMDIGDSHKKAFYKAFKEIYGLKIDYRIWKYHGFTDLQIIYDILEKYKIKKNPKKVAKMIEIMIKRFEKENLSHSVLMKGVIEILRKLKKQKDIIIGIVTGNLREIAYTKLKHFNIDEYFLVGGFGESSTIRADLIKIAIKEAEKFGKIKKTNVFIIGDTIPDIKAAKQAGVKVIAVATGTYSYKKLKNEAPDFLFHDLTNAKEIINVIRHG